MPEYSIHPQPRTFLPKDFVVTDWATLEPYFHTLAHSPIQSLEALQQWLSHVSELEAVISEDACWRQIKMTCDTENEALAAAFNYFVMELQPHIQRYSDVLNRKLADCSFTSQLTAPEYFPYLRNIKKNIALFRQENVPLQSELAVEAQQFGVISGKMTIRVEGKEYTLQQAAKFLENPDRTLRETVYRSIAERRLVDKQELNSLFDGLIKKRHQVAVQAGYTTYTDYRFAELGRFDYTKEDCFQFHEAVKQHVLPLVDDIYNRKKETLALHTLRPWDVDATPAGVAPLRPFANGAELLHKTIQCFNRLDPFFSNCLKQMDAMGRLDLESRKGKAPGGYNCPLAETGAPFIFMNAVGTLDDVTTMVHEGGHAVHSFLAHPLPLAGFKEYPMEIAEVASMSMELFSMEYWDAFFTNKEELLRAKEQQLERVLTIFPWIATIDSFQHWIYQNPTHTADERAAQWQYILNEFSPKSIDVTGLEAYRSYAWQRQLHLYEVPFYYIEYGIAQLGAIGLWQQFKADKKQALKNYTAALRLGGTRTLPELFATAGLTFNFSPEHIKNLMDFVKQEMNALRAS